MHEGREFLWTVYSMLTQGLKEVLNLIITFHSVNPKFNGLMKHYNTIEELMMNDI